MTNSFMRDHNGMVETDKMSKASGKKESRLIRSEGAATRLQPTADLQGYFCPELVTR